MLIGLLIAAALVAQVEASPPTDLQAQVRRLVRKLDAPEAETRDGAEKQLLELGPDILDLLSEHADDPPDLQERVSRVREKLSAQQAAKVMGAASKVTLVGSFSLEDALPAIEKQTGNKIVDYRQRFGGRALQGTSGMPVVPAPIKLQIKNSDFWPALDELLDYYDLKDYPMSGKDGLALVQRDHHDLRRVGRAAYAGPLRIEVNRVDAERRPTTNEVGSLKVNLQIAWEPRLAPILFTQDTSDLQIVDDNGKYLSVDTDQDTLSAPVRSGGTAVELSLPLVAPDRSVKKISSLKGALQAVVAGKTETLEFAKLSEAAKFLPLVQKKGAASVTLEKLANNNGLWEVGVAMQFENATVDPAAVQNWILRNEAYLKGPDGKRIDNAGFHTAEFGKDFGMIYQFELPQGLEGCTLVYQTASAFLTLHFDYELKDVLLP